MNCRLVPLVAVATGLFFCAGRPLAAQDIAEADFARLHALIKPGSSEDAWAKIPWLVNLGEARQRAAEQGKPILLWEMDGHPLGCT